MLRGDRFSRREGGDPAGLGAYSRAIMRILSDFDGVLTDPTHEMRRMRECFEQGLAARAGDAGLAALTEASAFAAAHPHLVGWENAGRISGYSDEDGFVAVNGIAARLDHMATSGHVGARSALDRLQVEGVTSFELLANRAFDQVAHETATGPLKPADPATAHVLAELMRRGHDVVIVSNSSTGRIQGILEKSGIRSYAHGDTPQPNCVRVRGDARKFELGTEPALFDAGRPVDINRPKFEALLREERPDVAIGDVFSFDLALPCAMRLRGEAGFANLRAVLRKRDYTPEWPTAYLRSESRLAWSAINDLTELLSLVRS